MEVPRVGTEEGAEGSTARGAERKHAGDVEDSAEDGAKGDT